MVVFSTIIPTFNRAGFIEATLKTLLGQECDEHEILIVDDGSTDGTLEVLAPYGDRIKVLQQNNKGPGAARNLGIRHATGQYITFLDSDDLWFPWTLATFQQAISAYDSPAFISGTPVVFENEAEIHTVKRNPLSTQLFADYYASSQQPIWILPGAAAIRADILRQAGGFTDRWINAEDSDLWLKLGTAKRFVLIQTPHVLAYRKHPNTAVSNYSRSHEGALHLLHQEKTKHYPGEQARQRERLEILTRHIRPKSFSCLHNGNVQAGWKLYQDTFFWHLKLQRIRYLVAFPAIASLNWFSQLASKTGWPNSQTQNSRYSSGSPDGD